MKKKILQILLHYTFYSSVSFFHILKCASHEVLQYARNVGIM